VVCIERRRGLVSWPSIYLFLFSLIESIPRFMAIVPSISSPKQIKSVNTSNNLYNYSMRLLIGHVWDMGCEIKHQSYVMMLSNRQENSSIFRDSFNAVIRLALIAERSPDIHIQILFHSIISCSHNLLSMSKIEMINTICDEIESNALVNGRVNIIHTLNNKSHVLFEERHLFHESLHRINSYLNTLSRRLLIVSSTLLGVMVSLAIVVAVLVVYTLIPGKNHTYFPYMLKSDAFEALWSINVIDLSSKTLIVQGFIVLFIFLASSGSSITSIMQRMYLSYCIRDARQTMRYDKAKNSISLNSMKKSYKYTYMARAVFVCGVVVVIVVMVSRHCDQLINSLYIPRITTRYD